MDKESKIIFMYTAGHFIVDFACAFLLYRLVYHSDQWYICLLYYNFCAFALQMPLGLLADKLNRNVVCAVTGCILTAAAFGAGGLGLTSAAFGTGSLGLTSAVIIAGIGNALYHIGGGLEVLNYSTNKTYLLGIFVSPGALGIYLGNMMGKQGGISVWFVISVLIALALCLLILQHSAQRSFRADNVPVSFEGMASSNIWLAIICIVSVVGIRSYLGMTSDFAWKEEPFLGILLICAVVFGKLAGGFLADLMGAEKAAVASLGISAVLYIFSNNPIAGIGAVFAFNMTMPITLWALAKIMKGSKGFAFGILTFSLFLGFLPVYFKQGTLISSPAGLAAAAFLSLILLWMSLRKGVS